MGRDGELTLTCPACDARLRLPPRGHLVAKLRPFVERHRACSPVMVQLDPEIRTA
jgi:hypothetical protein